MNFINRRQTAYSWSGRYLCHRPTWSCTISTNFKFKKLFNWISKVNLGRVIWTWLLVVKIRRTFISSHLCVLDEVGNERFSLRLKVKIDLRFERLLSERYHFKLWELSESKFCLSEVNILAWPYIFALYHLLHHQWHIKNFPTIFL